MSGAAPERVLEPDGRPVGGRAPEIGRIELLELHRIAATVERLEARLAAEAGRLGCAPYVPALGEAAALVAATTALPFEMPILPSARPAPVALARGVSPREYVRATRGALDGGRGAAWLQGFPEAGILHGSSVPGARALVAAGLAAARRRLGRGPALSITGWGALESPAFRGALDLARRWRAPAIFLVVTSRGGVEGAAVRAAEAAGIERARLVDGDDPLAARAAVSDLGASGDQGPALVEILATRRLGAEGASPGLDRLRRHLEAAGHLDATLREETERRIEVEIEAALSEPAPEGSPAAACWDGVLAAPGAEARRLRAAFERFGGEYGGDADPEGAAFLV